MKIPGVMQFYRLFINVYSSDLEFIAILPVGGDTSNPDMMRRLAEYACRINYLRRIGAWSMDYTDGELRWRNDLQCMNSTPSEDIITLDFILTSKEVQIWGPGFLSIILNGESAENAFRKCHEAQKK